MIKEKHITILTNYYKQDVIDDIISRWNEHHRYYHNIDHCTNMLDIIDTMFENTDNYIDYQTYVLATIFHDIVYDPKSNRNEEDSVKYFKKASRGLLHSEMIKLVSSLIMTTKSREIPNDEFQKTFWMIDNDVLIVSNLEQLIEYENKIFKEYQFVNYEVYKTKRINFLKNELHLNPEIYNLISYINSRKIKVGVYSGTFDPFHKGHLNVFNKAEKIFDKVILSYGNNPTKDTKTVKIPKYFNYHQVEIFSGLVTDYISKLENKNQDITLIRGLRNGDDLNYESNQLSFMKEFKPDIKVVYIPCDKEFEHISSSAIKNLYKFDEKIAKTYILE